MDAELVAAAREVLEVLRGRGVMVATAESCTGGLIAAALTEVAGSSDVVDRGFVTYSNGAKAAMLGVPMEVIEARGAVSEEVARAMAAGALARSDAGVAVAVTGVAGPGGGVWRSRWGRCGSGWRGKGGFGRSGGCSRGIGGRCGGRRCCGRSNCCVMGGSPRGRGARGGGPRNRVRGSGLGVAPSPQPSPRGRGSLVADVEVTGLGADGDGVARLDDGTALFLAGTLPGEWVRVEGLTRRGKGFAAGGEVLEASPDRVAPACRHFGVCGGCAVQHMGDAAYAAWKGGLVAEALGRLGFSGGVGELARTPPGGRRRMDLAIRREGAGVRIGLHAGRSGEVVDMEECPVLHPRLFGLVTALRPVLRSMQGLRREGSALVNLLDTGPDLLLRTDAVLTAGDRGRLAGLAEALGIPRIAWGLGARGDVEPACQLGPSTMGFSGRATTMPAGAFLQASAEGEAAIVAGVLAALPAKLKGGIIELFAGCGTLTHALATRGRVTAIEGDGAAVRALRGAADARVVVRERDLARQPLQAAELKGAGVVVLDPPFAGAAAQMAGLAASGAPIVYVSCNPAALVRDGLVLVGAGYRVVSGMAIDQFLWSPRVEAVVGFARG